MGQTRAEPIHETVAGRKRKAWPREAAVGIMFGIVAAGLLWLLLALVLHYLFR